MKKLLVYCILGACFLFSGCRLPECTQSALDECMEEYMLCLKEDIQNDEHTDYCLDEYCICLDEYNCNQSCEYKESCVEEEKPDT